MERNNRYGGKTYAVDQDVQGDRTHVGDARAGHLREYSKGQVVVQTTHEYHWKANLSALMGSC